MIKRIVIFVILCTVIICRSAVIKNESSTKLTIDANDVDTYLVEENDEYTLLEEKISIDEIEEKVDNNEVIDEGLSQEIIDEESEEIKSDNLLYNKDVDIIERINNYLGDDKDRTSFIYYNLITEDTLAFNEDLYMNAASLYKVGLSIVAYEMVNNGEITLDDLVYYSPWQYQGGTGILQYDLGFGALPLSTLIEYSIRYSDNIAATMVYSYIGGWNNFKRSFFELLCIDYGDYDNVTSARIELEALKYIYENRNNSNYSTLIDYLKNTDFHDRLDKYLPQDIVAHKIGSDEGFTHDVGIVLTEEPYIIIIMTDNVYNGPDKIADISKAMYLYNLENQQVKITTNHEAMLY